MKKNKKIIAMLVAVLTICACAFSASAATGISADEKKIINALSQKITMASGKVVALPDKYINQAEDYLTKAELTSDQITSILGYIKNAQNAVKASKAQSLSVAEENVKKEVVKEAQAAAAVINATLSVSSTPVTDNKGQVTANYTVSLVFNENSNVEGYTSGTKITLDTKDSEIVQTGAEGSVMAVVIGSVVVLAAAAYVVVVSGKKVFSK